MSEVENIDEIISLENIGFGSLLRNAREKKGLSLVDVCTELRLTEGVIYAIENQNLDQLPEAAYVCGYIRNYARFMQIEAGPLIDDFKQSMPIKSKLSSTNIIGRTLERKQEKKTVLFLFFLVVLLGAGVFFAWQLIGNKHSNYFSTESIQDILSNEKIKIKSLTADLSPGSQFATQVKVVENDAIPSNTEKPENKKGDTQLNFEGINTENSIVPQNQQAEQTAAIVQEKTTTETNISEVVVAIEALAEADEAVMLEKKVIRTKKQLQFKFIKNSWISVKDGNTKSLIYDLIHKGELLNLSGITPVSVFLGDGTGVELTVDGKLFDFSQFVNKKNIAKFVIESM